MSKELLVKKVEKEILKREEGRGEIIYHSFFKTAPWIGSYLIWRKTTMRFYVLLRKNSLRVYYLDEELSIIKSKTIEFSSIKHMSYSTTPHGFDLKENTLSVTYLNENGRKEIIDLVQSKLGEPLFNLYNLLNENGIITTEPGKGYTYAKYGYYFGVILLMTWLLVRFSQ